MAFENFSREELGLGITQALERDDLDLARQIQEELNSDQRQTTFGDVLSVVGQTGGILSESGAALNLIGQSDKEIVGNIFAGIQDKDAAELNAAIINAKNKLLSMGYTPDTMLPGGYTVEDVINGVSGMGSSLAITGLGMSGIVMGPAGLSVTSAAAAGAAYRMATQGLVKEIATLAKAEGLTQEETMQLINESMLDIRTAGAAEGAFEFVSNLAVGKFLRGPAQKLLGIKAGDAFVSKLAKRVGAGTISVGVGEVGSEGLTEFVQRQQRADISKITGLDMPESVPYSWASLLDSVHDTAPFAAIQGVAVGAPIGLTQTIAETDTIKNAKAKVLGDKMTLPHERGTMGQVLDSLTAAVFKKSVSVLDPYSKISPTAAKLRNMMEHYELGEGTPGQVKEADWHERKVTTAGDLFAPITQAQARVGRMSKEENNAVNQHIQGNAIPLNKNQTRALAEAMAGNYTSMNRLDSKEKRAVELAHYGEQVKSSLLEGESRLNNNGVELGYTRIGDVAPLFFDAKAIRKNRVQFENDLINKGYANDALHAQEITQNILDNQGVPFLNEAPNKTTGVVNRKFDPADINSTFINQDTLSAVPKHLMRISDRIAHSSLFGANGEVLNDMLKQIETEVRDQGRAVNPKDLQKVRDISKAMLGKYNQFRHEGVRQVNRGIAALETVSTLGSATLASIQEPFLLINQMGLTNFVKSLPGSFAALGTGLIRSMYKGIPKNQWVAAAEYTGVALDQAHMEMLTAATTIEHIPLADKFFRSPFGLFLHQWTRSIRIMGVNAALKRLDQLRGIEDSPRKEQMLLDLGMTLKDFNTINDAVTREGLTIQELFITQGRGEGPKAVAVDSILRTELSDGVTIGSLLKPAVARFVNQSVVAPRATNRPLWMNDPHWALIAQLKSFPIVFGNTVVKGLINKINPEKNKHLSPCDLGNVLATTGALLGAALIGIHLKDSTKEKVYKAEGRVKGPLNSELGRAIQQTGLLGAMDFVVNTFNYGPQGLLGPTYGDANKLIKAVSELANDDISSDDFLEYLGDRTAKAFGAANFKGKLGKELSDIYKDIF